jgi:hypothetical protein
VNTCNEYSGSIKEGKFIDYLYDYQFLKNYEVSQVFDFSYSLFKKLSVVRLVNVKLLSTIPN